MGLYLAVAPVLTEGEPVPPPMAPGGAATPPGQRLIAVVDNGEWQVALDVSHPSRYRKLLCRVTEGVWRDMRLYMIAEERALALADGHRAMMDGRLVRDPGQTARHSAARN